MHLKRECKVHNIEALYFSSYFLTCDVESDVVFSSMPENKKFCHEMYSPLTRHLVAKVIDFLKAEIRAFWG